ncbi:MAG: hypothetical protein SGI73_04030 [Chloroflexota bacterium]|nr:hypothetical protein [Chloroflexota bacterium]
MAVEFYDVKTRQKVSIDDKNVFKTTFETKNGQVRYGLRGKTDDGRMLTKFVSKGDWDGATYAEEKSTKAEEPKKADAKAKPAATKDAPKTTKKK